MLEALSRAGLSVWAPPAVGALCALLVFLAGRFVRQSVSTGRSPSATPPSTGPIEPTPPPTPSTPGEPPEKRSHERRQGTWIPVLLSDAEGESKPVRGAVLDRSAGGLALSTDTPVQPGTVLSVRAVEHFQEMPWVQVTVRNCRRKGTKYVLGCQFLCLQPWNILVFFG